MRIASCRASSTPVTRKTHREASRLLGDRAIVIKGEGGEIEVNPDVVAHLYGCDQGEAWDEEWPALSTHRHMKPEQLDPGFLRAVWDGREGDAYGHLAVLSSMALALRALGKNREEAFKEAAHYWATRNESI